MECKDGRKNQGHPERPVLIETLWNVKTESYSLHLVGGPGINRNIVECKDRIVRGDTLCGMY